MTSTLASTSKLNIGDANAENGSELILYVNICTAIDTMLNFDGETNADVKCEQAFTGLPGSSLTRKCNSYFLTKYTIKDS